MNRVALWFILAYQRFVSNFLGASCKYVPSCSEYAKMCFEKYSPTKALFKTICRLLRCHPFAKGGLDLPIVVLLSLTAICQAQQNVNARKIEAQRVIGKPKILYLSENAINLRSGPGVRYGILKKLHQKHYPVVLHYQMDGWSKISTFSGSRGWVRDNFLKSGKSANLVIIAPCNLFSSPREDGSQICQIKAITLAKKIQSIGRFVQIEIRSGNHPIIGWTFKEFLWGDV